MTGTQRGWSLKKRFDRHREKFSRICRPISVEQSRNSSVVSRAKRCKLSPHHFTPRHLLFACRQCRRAIGGEILVIELVSKFVQDNVFAVRRVGCAGFHRVPCEHHRSHRAAGLAESRHFSFFPNGTFDMASFFQEPKDHNSKSNARLESKPQIDTDFHRLGTKLFYCCRKPVFHLCNLWMKMQWRF